MAKSLQEQLLQAGLVDKKKATQVRKNKNKRAKQARRGQDEINETDEWVKKAREEKAERDRELNRKVNEEAHKKAIAAQIVQLVENNKIDREKGDVGYQFVDAGKVKKIYVTGNVQERLARGQAAIARLRDSYEVIPKMVAEKILERAEGTIVVYNKAEVKEVATEDDPYADYQIPDDLMW
ncbi:MAG: nucleoprotein/polynucleotide-associated enzyme [Gammaproteobacteria bacterium]|nr:MAG: nucleoprotein/polynucleotide-associated enzyme [Gammaproteobacteria bacterium]